jgi:phosphoglycerate kinase
MTPQSLIVSIDAIPQEQLRRQRVLVRIDAQDEVKLSDALSTLVFLSQSGARVVVATHSPVDDLLIVLTRLLGRPVAILDKWKGETGLRAIAHLLEGEITMMKDLALEPGEEADDDELADALSHLCDLYCNEAFALSHELRASTVGVARKAPLAVAGRAFHRDLLALEALLEEPRQHVLAVLGGVLSKDKLLLAEQIAKGSDRVLVAGQLCFPFLIASGRVFHGPAVADELITIAERMLTEARDEKRFILTPVDFTVVEHSKFERLARGEPYVFNPPTENVREQEIKADHVICDIGTVTQWSWTEYFAAARKIFWHGPMGITEIDLFRAGTRFLAEQLAIRTSGTAHCTMVCGSSLVAALRSIGFRKEKHIHLTSAGRTALQLFAGFPLPAVEALSSSAGTEQKRCRVLIPLDGSDRDVETLRAATGILPRNAQLFLLHVRSGLDEEQHPDVAAALSEADRLERRLESVRIFARANSVLAACGLFSADQVADQGKRAEVITRHARRLKAELIVVAAGSREPNALRGVDANTTHSTLIARPNAEGDNLWIG